MIRDLDSARPTRALSLLASLPCALAVCAMLFVAPAQAKTVHVFAGSFGGEGTGPGQFKAPVGIAVNDTTHDVYVVDSLNNRVQEFNATGSTVIGEFDGAGSPTGVFSEPTQVAVDNSGNPLDSSNGDVYVVDSGNGVIDKFSETGAYVGQITGATCETATELPPCAKSKLVPFHKGEAAGIEGIAVDPKGALWADEFSGNVYEFGDGLDNEYVRTVTPTGGLLALAVDSEDNLYLQLGGEGVAKFSSSGTILRNPFGRPQKGGQVNGIAVDGNTNSVYIDYTTEIEAFTEGGSKLESFGAGHLEENPVLGLASKGVAVDASNGTVYVSDVTTNNVLIFDAVTLPTVSLAALSEQLPRSVTLNGTVNPEGSAVTLCVFEYDTREYKEGEGAHGTSVPCETVGGKSIGGGSSPVPVSAHLPGLTPGTRYDYRLVAENSAHIPSVTPNQEFTAGPILGGAFVTNVFSESATLNVPIDPNGDDTHYYFQFGTSTSYGFEVPLAAPGVDLGSTPGVQNLSVHLQTHLAPGTVYHYRVVVSQNGEEFTEPDRTFTTQSVPGASVLPDGRAWELVSPADNRGGLIEQFANGINDAIQAASDGSGITYLTAGVAVGEEPHGRNSWSQTLSTRVPGGGWRSQDLTLPRRILENEQPAAQESERPEYEMFSSDLSLAEVAPSAEGTPPLSPEASERTIYLRDDLHGSYAPLVTAGNVPPGTEFGGTLGDGSTEMFFVTATADLSHVLLATPFALTPEAVYESSYAQVNQWNLYEWSAGRLQLVNILPEAEGGEPTRGDSPSVRLADGSQAEGTPSGVNPSAVSSDGRRVAWDLGTPHVAGANPKEGLYVRDMVDESTVKVSGLNGVFQWMSSSGSDVFFLEDGDLKVCEIVETEGKISCAYSDLTADHGAGESNAGVQELVSDVSQDGSYVYFVAKGVLAGASGAISGEDNLYLLHDSAGLWSTTYIATLSPGDEKDWFKSDGKTDDRPDLSGISSRVSPNGRYLAFMSDRPLTGYDNTDAVSGQPDQEVFVYDAQGDGGTGALACASCDPTGARPVGVLDQGHDDGNQPLLVDRPGVWAGSWLAGSIPGWDNDFAEGSQYQPRYLSDSGRLFFNSPDGLVPRATNGVEDVYEFEPVGIGGCTEGASSGVTVFVGASGGCVGLVSSGLSSQESAFFDASENGDDVFFITEAKLAADATLGHSYAVYDAHVCGGEGVPCASEPASPPPCSSGDSCKPAPSPQPEIFGPAPSATFSGAGNVTPIPPVTVKKITKKKPVKCGKGFTKEKNRCVKNRKSKRAKKAGHGRSTK